MKNTLTKKLSILLASLLLISSFTSLHAFASDPPLPIIPDNLVESDDRIMRGVEENSSSSWGDWFNRITDRVVQIIRSSIFNSIYPVGTIYMTVTEVNPQELFGGTWVSWGCGRVPVGVNNSIADFSTIERIGGEIAHTLTTEEMPSHYHRTDGNGGHYGWGGNPGGWRWGGDEGGFAADLGTVNTGNAGGNRAHNNLPPYITCYMWKRVA